MIVTAGSAFWPSVVENRRSVNAGAIHVPARRNTTCESTPCASCWPIPSARISPWTWSSTSPAAWRYRRQPFPPGRVFYDNLMMGTQPFTKAGRPAYPSFQAIGTICAYPKFG